MDSNTCSRHNVRRSLWTLFGLLEKFKMLNGEFTRGGVIDYDSAEMFLNTHYQKVWIND
jgi:hypothetical protein